MRYLLTIILLIFLLSKAHASMYVEIILDASNSMWDKLDGAPKIEIARETLVRFIKDLPQDVNILLKTYGHRSQLCDDIETVVRFDHNNAQDVENAIRSINPQGRTPIANALYSIEKDFPSDTDNVLILVSDGKETCGGDPCQALKDLESKGLKMRVHIIGFGVEEQERAELECIAKAGDGVYYNAANGFEFQRDMESVKDDILSRRSKAKENHTEPQKPSLTPCNLLTKEKGARLLAAPNQSFKLLFDGDLKTHTEAAREGDEMIFAFKDNQLARLCSVSVAIIQPSEYNPKTFEALVSKEQPVTADFTSIATVELSNEALSDSPFQTFEFQPVEARYLKLKHLNAVGDNEAYYYEVKVTGELLGEETAAPLSKQAQDADLILADNGGRLVAATKPSFELLNDGDEKKRTDAIWEDDEAIFAFKDNRLAQIHAIALPIFEQSKHNPLEIEALIAVDKLDGEFQSLGAFKLANTWLSDSPYQVFSFDPVQARYIKLRHLKSVGGSEAYYYEARVYGQLLGQETALKEDNKMVGDNLLLPSKGGKLIVASNPSLKILNDGADQLHTDSVWANDEAVFAFKDYRLARIHGVAIPILEKNKYNPAEIEVLASKTSPAEGFKSVGQCKFWNIRLASVYQNCMFEPFEVRYMKFRHLKAFGDNQGYYYELRAFGELLSEETAEAPIKTDYGQELLALDKGGNMIVATNPSMSVLNDGDEVKHTDPLTPNDEAIFAFKDKALVELRAAAFPIWETNKNNPKEIEIMVTTDENPTKGYFSLGKASLMNSCFIDEPYQIFPFGPVQARYIKIKLISSQSTSPTYLYEARVYGRYLE